MAEDGNQREPRVAVIAVHGVADQREGETARSVAELLERLPPQGVQYGPASEESFLVKVETVRSLRDLKQADPPPQHLSMFSRAWWKKFWRQSYGSDFHREDWSVQAHAAKDTIAVDRRQDAGMQSGPDLTEFMLFKACRTKTPAEAWRSRKLSMPRAAQGGRTRVDVFEMYWADLSRLSGALPRIVTELFTLLFRLSVLGRDTVRIALAAMAMRDGAWRQLRRTQTWLDWIFSRVLALLTLQLAMLALVILPMGLLDGHQQWIAPLAAGIVVFAGYLLACYAGPPWLRHWSFALAVALAAIGAGWAVHALPYPEGPVGLLWLVVLTATYWPLMRAVDGRFPMTAPFGWFMWGLVVGGLVVFAALQWDSYAGLAVWVKAALRVLELALVAMFIVWVVIGLLMVWWFVAGSRAVHSGVEHAQAIVSTGRLGVFASGSFFLVIAMVLWAMLSKPLEYAAASAGYVPLFFEVAGQAPSATLAREFLADRFNSSTALFSLIALIDLALVAYLVVFFVPSVVVELSAKVKLHPGRLGRWLSIGYEKLDTHPIRWLSGLSALVCIVAAGYLGWWLSHRLGLVATAPTHPVIGKIEAFSRNGLAPFVIGAGSLTLALSAFGGLLSRYVPWLRAPLDVALDVDNHFREFPRKAIPRARIVARYMALLRHLDAQNYDRIVIVAHSQGTVITTELLHYMHERAQLAARPGATPDPEAALVARIAAKTRLLTLGCPLRQLYGARFPTLYPWVLKHGGPTAAELGVQRWVNGYMTGDYVGRWLWHDEAERYQPATRATAVAGLANGAAEVDVCLGAGAHTHYFDVDPDEDDPPAAKVIDLVDMLVDMPRLHNRVRWTPSRSPRPRSDRRGLAPPASNGRGSTISWRARSAAAASS